MDPKLTKQTFQETQQSLPCETRYLGQLASVAGGIGGSHVSVLGYPVSLSMGTPLSSTCLARAWGLQAFLILISRSESLQTLSSVSQPQEAPQNKLPGSEVGLFLGEREPILPSFRPQAEPEICVQSAQGNCVHFQGLPHRHTPSC